MLECTARVKANRCNLGDCHPVRDALVVQFVVDRRVQFVEPLVVINITAVPTYEDQRNGRKIVYVYWGNFAAYSGEALNVHIFGVFAYCSKLRVNEVYLEIDLVISYVHSAAHIGGVVVACSSDTSGYYLGNFYVYSGGQKPD